MNLYKYKRVTFSIFEFYKAIEEDVNNEKNALIFIYQVNKQIVGAVRLIKNDGYFTLRTLYVIPEWRHKGIATALIRELIDHIPLGSILYCLPYPQVRSLYSNLGFVHIHPDNLPETLKRRYEEYIKEFDVISMKYCK